MLDERIDITAIGASHFALPPALAELAGAIVAPAMRRMAKKEMERSAAVFGIGCNAWSAQKPTYGRRKSACREAVMAELRRKPGEWVRHMAIAERSGVTADYVRQLTKGLREAGFVETRKPACRVTEHRWIGDAT